MPLTKRILMLSSLAFPLMSLHKAQAAVPTSLAPTPSCGHGEEQTLEKETGPYFLPGSPMKRDLYLDAPTGQRITVAGFVMDISCKPLAGRAIEIWHADQNGKYDGTGFRLRGHVLSDREGRWWFNTIVPAPYERRTRHFHFKVQRPGRGVLTTQLFFPGEPRNADDYLFDERLQLRMSNSSDGPFARFDFVI
jgi:protocatechuate 3,4-dioxygenase beta subunit